MRSREAGPGGQASARAETRATCNWPGGRIPPVFQPVRQARVRRRRRQAGSHGAANSPLRFPATPDWRGAGRFPWRRRQRCATASGPRASPAPTAPRRSRAETSDQLAAAARPAPHPGLAAGRRPRGTKSDSPAGCRQRSPAPPSNRRAQAPGD
ncbi:hypothetical protein G6F50_015893 [Rhizopus delemar]|uniref:Uncharacterized protein n=1 Tax=Rhizopus delemar TaxID=936053 RepID=A0A9P7C2Z1_9FUNG|nr:hypothetical protein G6F50_015893 [Rhizopus delemar]